MRNAAELMELANKAEEHGNYRQALRLHQRALQIKELVVGPHNLELAPYLYNLGMIHYALDNKAQAEVAFTCLLQILLDHYEENDKEVLEIKQLLVSLYTDEEPSIEPLPISA